MHFPQLPTIFAHNCRNCDQATKISYVEYASKIIPHFEDDVGESETK